MLGGFSFYPLKFLAGLSAAGAFLIAAVSPPNSWYLTSATFNSSTASLYFNGTLQGTLPFGQDFVRLLIVGSNGQGGAFAGAVTGLQMWNRALAPSEHAALMAGPTSLPPAPPPSSPSPPPGAPLLRDNFLTLTTSNPPAGVVVITGPPEDVISYTGYCQDEYKEQAGEPLHYEFCAFSLTSVLVALLLQDSPAVAFRSTDGTMFLNAGNEQGNVRSFHHLLFAITIRFCSRANVCQYRMIRAPQPGPVLVSQFIRDCLRPPFVGTNVLQASLNPNADPSTLYPFLYASPWNVAGCVPQYVNDTYFGYFSPNMFISGTGFLICRVCRVCRVLSSHTPSQEPGRCLIY